MTSRPEFAPSFQELPDTDFRSSKALWVSSPKKPVRYSANVFTKFIRKLLVHCRMWSRPYVGTSGHHISVTLFLDYEFHLVNLGFRRIWMITFQSTLSLLINPMLINSKLRLRLVLMFWKLPSYFINHIHLIMVVLTHKKILRRKIPKNTANNDCHGVDKYNSFMMKVTINSLMVK